MPRYRMKAVSMASGTRPPKTSTSKVMFGLVVGLTLIALGAVSLARQSGAFEEHKVVDFTLPDFSGNATHLSDFRGRPVLVNLWASWCIPCREEMPALIEFAQQHQREGLVLLPIDVQDEEANAIKFMREQNMTMPVLFDPAGSVFPVLGANALPATFVIDRSGAIRFAWVGPLSPATLDSRVKPLLSQ